MPVNIEIKAKVPADFEKLKETVQTITKSELTTLSQEDTFFNAVHGRLKLREFRNDDKPSQLIAYKREDKKGPTNSDFLVTFTTSPKDLKETLSMALGIQGVVKKERLLAFAGQTRIHLDTVEGLGNFLELEVQMRPDQSSEEGERIAYDLMDQLGIKEEHLITCAYHDLLMQKTKDNETQQQ